MYLRTFFISFILQWGNKFENNFVWLAVDGFVKNFKVFTRRLICLSASVCIAINLITQTHTHASCAI